MTPDEQLAAALIAIYVAFSLPVIYIGFRHGTRGLAWLGWGYLLAFCLLKMIGSGMAVNDPASTGAAIVDSVGLSPLLYASAGILHEAIFFRMPPSVRQRRAKLDVIAVLLFHILVAGAIALVAIGISSLASDAASPSAAAGAWRLAAAGGALLFIAWVAVVLAAMVAALARYAPHSYLQRRVPAYDDGTRLLLGVLLAMPFLGVRVVGSLVFFAGRDPRINPATGPVGPRVGLYFIQEIIITLIFVVVGLLTRHVRADAVEEGRLEMESEALEGSG